MDKKWQDIFYIDDSKPKCLPTKYYVLAIRCVQLINISFSNDGILITYVDVSGQSNRVELKKLLYHKLLIE